MKQHFQMELESAVRILPELPHSKYLILFIKKQLS